MRIVAIDPGAGGAIAWCDIADGLMVRVATEKMPDGMTAVVAYLKNLIGAGTANKYAFMEKVGGYMPGNSGPAAVKFARHCGQVETALYCLGYPTVMVAPQTWMKSLGTLPHDKAERKRRIKELMQRRFPAIPVTLVTADALGILVWAAKQKGTDL